MESKEIADLVGRNIRPKHRYFEPASVNVTVTPPLRHLNYPSNKLTVFTTKGTNFSVKRLRVGYMRSGAVAAAAVACASSSRKYVSGFVLSTVEGSGNNHSNATSFISFLCAGLSKFSCRLAAAGIIACAALRRQRDLV